MPSALIVTLLFLASLASIASAQGVPLKAATRSAVGDVATFSQSASIVSSVTNARKQILQDYDFVKSLDMTMEVLKVDPQGRPVEIQARVLWARQTIKSTVPRQRAFAKTISLGKVFFVVRRQKDAWRVDTASVASTTMKGFTASELYLLKRVFQDVIECQSRTDRLLLSDKPQAVGDSWKVSPEGLAAWAAANVSSGRIQGKVQSAQARVEQVKGSVATVVASLVLATGLDGVEVKPRYQITLRIDVPTGRFLSKTTRLTLTSRGGEAVMSHVGQGQETLVYKAGSGTASVPPARFTLLGWKNTPDTNNTRYAAAGASLNIPKEFKAAGEGKWTGPAGSSIAVHVGNNDQMLDMEQMLPMVRENIRKSSAGYEAIETRTLTLADNMPAALVSGKVNEGKVVLLNLIALDGPRILSVTAAVPADKPDVLKSVTAAAKSLRVYTPGAAK